MIRMPFDLSTLKANCSPAWYGLGVNTTLQVHNLNHRMRRCIGCVIVFVQTQRATGLNLPSFCRLDGVRPPSNPQRYKQSYLYMKRGKWGLTGRARGLACLLPPPFYAPPREGHVFDSPGRLFFPQTSDPSPNLCTLWDFVRGNMHWLQSLERPSEMPRFGFRTRSERRRRVQDLASREGVTTEVFKVCPFSYHFPSYRTHAGPSYVRVRQGIWGFRARS